MTLVDRKDPDAFEVFYDRHGGAAYSLAHRIVEDREIAEDVAQEAFLSIWRSKARFDAARGSVRAWVLGIVRNRAIDSLSQRLAARPEARSRRRDGAREPAGHGANGGRGDPPDTAGHLRRALGVLPREQSQVIELAYFGGFSHSEIAEMLGAPLGTIKGGCASVSRRSGRPWRRACRGKIFRGLPVSHDPMPPAGHEHYRDDLAAYALGALEEPEAAELQRHLAECEACRIELRWLEPAVDMLPRSIRAARATARASASD